MTAADIHLPEFHLHFEGDETRGHTVPATELIQAMQALQRSIELLAIAYEGQATKQRLRISHAMERKYAVIFGIPTDGGYDLPYHVGSTATKLFDPDDIATVTNQHKTVLEAVQSGNAQALRRAIPSEHIRRLVMNELRKMQPPARTGLVVSIENSAKQKLFDGRTAIEKLTPLLIESSNLQIHPRLVTGRLDALDFQAHTLKLKLPNERMLSGTYSEDFEPVLLENPREWIQVRGEAVLNEDGSLNALNNITEIIEVDDSPIVTNSLEIDGITLAAKQPIEFTVSFDPSEGIYTASGDFHMMVSAETREELETSVDGALIFLWKEYVVSDPRNFSADALSLRKNLNETFPGAADAA
jgi:hypothetical protein